MDGLDVTSLFSNFVITINSDLTYTTNSDVFAIDTFPWPQGGFFLINDNLTQLTRDDGLIIDVAISEDQSLMTLEFTYSSEFDNAGSRTNAVSGEWKFGLSRKN